MGHVEYIGAVAGSHGCRASGSGSRFGFFATNYRSSTSTRGVRTSSRMTALDVTRRPCVERVHPSSLDLGRGYVADGPRGWGRDGASTPPHEKPTKATARGSGPVALCDGSPVALVQAFSLAASSPHGWAACASDSRSSSPRGWPLLWESANRENAARQPCLSNASRPSFRSAVIQLEVESIYRETEPGEEVTLPSGTCEVAA